MIQNHLWRSEAAVGGPDGSKTTRRASVTAKVVEDRGPAPSKVDRSRQIFKVVQYNWIICPTLLVIAYRLAYRFYSDPAYTSFYLPVDESTWWNQGSLIWLLIFFPGHAFLDFSMLATFWPCQPFRLSEQPPVRSFNRLLICLVTRGDQEKVVRRSLLPVQGMVPKVDPRISLHILTEERNADKFRGEYEEHVQVHAVPASYVPRVARHKARSMEWFRLNMKLQDDDWVLHIDEETAIDEYMVRRCVEFITRQTHDDIGTGVIHYNLEGAWSSILPGIGDLSRVQDDWGRCQWAANGPHRAALGIHGAFFLSSGRVENAVTWETGHLTEDYAFLLKAMAAGFRIGWVPAIAKEVSPRSLGDYMRQRRRWFTGIRTLGRLEGRLIMGAWLWALVEYAYGAWMWATHSSPEPVPRWLFCLIVGEFACFKLFTFLMVLVQDWHADASWTSMVFSQLLAQVLRPYVNLLDSVAVVLSLVRPDNSFYIVQKE